MIMKIRVVNRFICALTVCGSLSVYAQTDSVDVDSMVTNKAPMRAASSSFTDGFDLQVPKYTPQAPNVAGLVNQLDYPVSLYTGVPNISIPIYEIDADGMKIPITLSYHASGIRVNQEASWVGLGWSLNAGGVVSRTIKCGDDFYEYVPPGGELQEGYITAPEMDYPRDSGYISPACDYNLAKLRKDSEPDIFYYSFPGASGKFLIDKSRGAVLFDKGNNVKIEYFNDGAIKKFFVITSTDGTKYTFNKYEKTSSYSRQGYLNQNMYNATKFDEYEDKLNQIYSSPFEYTSSWMLTDINMVNGQHVTFEYEEETYQAPVQESASKYHIMVIPEVLAGPTEGEVVYSCIKTLVNTWRLSKISWNSGYVVFEGSTREDEKGILTSTNPQKLNSIIVYNKINQIVKKVNFNYDYFNRSYTGIYPHVFKRLKLTGISEPLAENCKYKFDYYEGSLPAKNSKNTDYWGYYNGINQGANYYCPITYNNVAYEGADKSSNFDYMVIGTLKSVTSPTAGKTTFVYEPNQYKVTPMTSVVTHNIKEGMNVFNEYNYDTYSQYPKTMSQRITLPVASQIKVSGFAENEGCVVDNEVRYDHDDNATFKISKLNSDGSKQLIFYYPTPSEMQTDCSYTFPTQTIQLSKGDFIIEAEAHAKDTWYAFFYEYDKTETITPDSILIGGGLRVKEIKGAENKSYEYEDGKLLAEPVFGRLKTMVLFDGSFAIDGSGPYRFETKYLIRQSESFLPMSTLKDGNIFGYSTVKEKNGFNTTTHHFCNDKEHNYGGIFSLIPPKVSVFNGLETETIQDNKTTTYYYDTRKAEEIKAFVFDAEDDLVYDYSYEIEWPLLSKVTTTAKEVNGNFVTSNVYTYNDNFMKETESISDVSGTYTKKYIYPDVTDTGVTGTMANKYMIGVPIKTLLLLNGTVIDGRKTNYINSSDKILPSGEYRIACTSGLPLSNYESAFVQELNYLYYNTFGKPMQITSKGLTTVYLWSYDGSLPVAEIRNSTYVKVLTTLSINFISALAKKSMPTESDMQNIDSLREKLPNALVTTYTYNPLIGVTSITDERGFTTYYNYDAAGRLSESYIMIGGLKSVLEKYNYNYRR